MAGPAKYLVQLALAGAQIVGRAFARALREEIQKSQNAAASRTGGTTRDTTRAAAVSSRMGMTAQEAKQILNIGAKDNKEVDLTEIQEKYDHLFKANDKAVGGSFYLQSKVVRAKERLEEELKLSSAAEEAKKQSAEAKQTAEAKQSAEAEGDTSRRARRRASGTKQD